MVVVCVCARAGGRRKEEEGVHENLVTTCHQVQPGIEKGHLQVDLVVVDFWTFFVNSHRRMARHVGHNFATTDSVQILCGRL